MLENYRPFIITFGISFIGVICLAYLIYKYETAIETIKAKWVCPKSNDQPDSADGYIEYLGITTITLIVFLFGISPNIPTEIHVESNGLKMVWKLLVESSMIFTLMLVVVGFVIDFLYEILFSNNMIKLFPITNLSSEERGSCLVMGCLLTTLIIFIKDSDFTIHLSGMKALAIFMGKYLWLDSPTTLSKLKGLWRRFANGSLFPVKYSIYMKWRTFTMMCIGLTLVYRLKHPLVQGILIFAGGSIGIFFVALIDALKEWLEEK